MATIPVYGKIIPKEDRATSIYEANDTMKMLGYMHGNYTSLRQDNTERR
nr:MAG TPA: hypothetical protein [Caudoviricetes sp.]